MIAASAEDSIVAAIVQWIPVEILAAYHFIIGFVPPSSKTAPLYIALAFVPLTFGWIAVATRDDDPQLNSPIAWRQSIIAPIAFAVWAVGTQLGVMQHLCDSWEGWMGSVTLGLGTISLPILDGVLKRLGLTQG